MQVDETRQTRNDSISSASTPGAPKYSAGEAKFNRNASADSKNASSPLDFFLLFFCPVIINMICAATNAFQAANPARSTWKPLTPSRASEVLEVLEEEKNRIVESEGTLI
jgi:hypothetical protein